MELVVVGHLSRDLLITPDYTKESLGGGTAYAMLAPAIGALGCGIVTKVGEDFEQKYIDTLRMAAVDMDGLHVSGPYSTRFINEYDRKGNRIQRIASIAPPITNEDFLPMHLKANTIHFCPLSPSEISIQCFQEAHSTDALISLDIQGFLREIVDKQVILKYWENKDEILQWCHVVKADEVEIKCALGVESEEDAALDILDRGPNIVIVTRDQMGSTIYTKEEKFDIPIVLAKEVIDTTGSGDTYTIGFLLEYQRSGDVKRAGLFGAACASFNLESIGPYRMPTRAQVLERMNHHNHV